MRLALLPLLIVSNLFAFWALRNGARHCFAAQNCRTAVRWITAIALLLNLPLLIFFFPEAGAKLELLSPDFLRVFFYPSAAWMATLIVVLLLAIAALPFAAV